MQRIKGYVPKKQIPEAPTLSGSISSVMSTVEEMKGLQKDVIFTLESKVEDVDTKLTELTDTVNSSLENVDKVVAEKSELFDGAIQHLVDTTENAKNTIEETKNEALQIIKDTKQGEPGKDSDPKAIISAVVKQIPVVDVKKLKKDILASLPDRKADLKIIQESITTDPMSVIDKILALAEEGKFKLKSTNIDGLDQTMNAFYNQVGRRGYLHGGGISEVIHDATLTGKGTVANPLSVVSAGGVTSFNTRTGAITLLSSDVTGALGFTPYNATNPAGYITSAGAPVQSVFGRTGTVVAVSGDYTTAQVTESGNLYFTNARAIASTLTGYVSGAGTISSADTILTAIQKLNGNIAAIPSGVTSITIASTNGFAGSSSGGATPALTISTSITGILKGNGTAISAAVAGTDYQVPITLTTTGSSGAATFSGGTLNIPIYSGGGGGTPGGSNTQVQYNNSGAFGGITGLTTNGNTISYAPTARTSGALSYLAITTPADTGITANTESRGVNFISGTRTWADGTVPSQSEYYFGAPTYNKTTTAATFTQVQTAFFGMPIAGTGVTFTNPYTAWFNGNVHIGSILGNSPINPIGGTGIELAESNNTTGGQGVVVTNTSNGVNAFSEFNLNNDTSVGSTYSFYAGMYLNSSGYTNTTFGTGVATPNQLAIQNATGGPITLATSGTGATNGVVNVLVGGFATTNEIARFTATGLGIGTTTVNSKFHLVDSTLRVEMSSSKGFQVITTGTDGWTNIGTSSSAIPIFNCYNSGNTSVFRVDGAGNIIQGPASLTGSTATSAYVINQTFNTSGAPDLFQVNLTNTASNAAANIVNYKVATTSNWALRATGNVVHAPQSVTGSATTSAHTITQTLNTSGVLDVFQLNVTNTASGAGSHVIHSKVGGNSKWFTDMSGNVSQTGNLGIGTATNAVAVTKIQVSIDGTTANTGLYNTAADGIFITGNSQVGARIMAASGASGTALTTSNSAFFALQGARGTMNSPAVVATSDVLGFLNISGYDGAARQTSSRIRGEVDAAVSSGIIPGRIIFSTANSAGTLTDALTIDSVQVSTFAGDVKINTLGKTIFFKTGSNAKAGTATLVGGTVTISTTAITANSIITLSIPRTGLLNVGTYEESARTAGTSFVITSSNVLDTSTFDWVLMEKS